jgi:hypothetical protein
MNKKPIQTALDQLKESQTEAGEGFAELSSDEAEELAGGAMDKNTGCPVYNTGCPQSHT